MFFKKKQKITTPPPRTPRTEQQGSPVFSYYSSRDTVQERSGMAPRDESNTAGLQKGRYIPSFLVLFAIIVGLLYFSTLKMDPRVIVQSNRAETVLRNPDVYGAAAQELLTESPLNRSKMTIDTASLSRKLQEQFPEVRSVTVTLPIASRRPVIVIQPAVPSLILSATSDSYVLDDSGRAILVVSETNNVTVPELPVVRDESGLAVEVGKNVLPKQTVDYIGTVLAQLEAKQLEPEALTLPALANELHVRIKGQPYFVKFNTAGDPLAAVGTFLAVKQRLENDGQLLKEYIDVRVGERAYYK